MKRHWTFGFWRYTNDLLLLLLLLHALIHKDAIRIFIALFLLPKMIYSHTKNEAQWLLINSYFSLRKSRYYVRIIVQYGSQCLEITNTSDIDEWSQNTLSYKTANYAKNICFESVWQWQRFPDWLNTIPLVFSHNFQGDCVKPRPKPSPPEAFEIEKEE